MEKQLVFSFYDKKEVPKIDTKEERHSHLSYRTAFMILMSLLTEKMGRCESCEAVDDCTFTSESSVDDCGLNFFDHLLNTYGEEAEKILTCENCPMGIFCANLNENAADNCTEVLENWIDHLEI